jgi:hypothetical protein
VQPSTPFDDVAWEQSEKVTDGWMEGLFEESTLRATGGFIVKHRGGMKSDGIPKPVLNIIFRMIFQDGGSVVIDFPNQA